MSTKDVVLSHSLLGLEYGELIFAFPRLPGPWKPLEPQTPCSPRALLPIAQ